MIPIPAIPSHSTGTASGSWDGNAAETAMDNTAANNRQMYAPEFGGSRSGTDTGSSLLVRAHHTDLEVRADGDGRMVRGIAVPWDEVARIREGGREYDETFRRGAFAKTIAERGPKVKFRAEHNRQVWPLGRAHLLREDSHGLYGEWRVAQTPRGDEVLELVRDGVLDGLSIGFRPVPGGDRWSRDRSSVERVEVALFECSVVEHPAYSGAVIAGVRAAGSSSSLPIAVAQRRLSLLQRSW